MDTWDNRIVEFEPGMEKEGQPNQRLTKAPRERHLAYTLTDSDQDELKVGRGVLDPPSFDSQVREWEPKTQPNQRLTKAPRERHLAYTLTDSDQDELKVGRGVLDPPEGQKGVRLPVI